MAVNTTKREKLWPLTLQSLPTQLPAAAEWDLKKQEMFILCYSNALMGLKKYEKAVFRALSNKKGSPDIDAIKAAQRKYLCLFSILSHEFKADANVIDGYLKKVNQKYVQACENLKINMNLSFKEQDFTRSSNIWAEALQILKEEMKETALFPVVEGLYSCYQSRSENDRFKHKEFEGKELTLRLFNFIHAPKTADRDKLIDASKTMSGTAKKYLPSREDFRDKTMFSDFGWGYGSYWWAIGGILGVIGVSLCNPVLGVMAITFLTIGIAFFAPGFITRLSAQGERDGKFQAAAAIEITPQQLRDHQPRPQRQNVQQQSVTSVFSQAASLFSPLRDCFVQTAKSKEPPVKESPVENTLPTPPKLPKGSAARFG